MDGLRLLNFEGGWKVNMGGEEGPLNSKMVIVCHRIIFPTAMSLLYCLPCRI